MAEPKPESEETLVITRIFNAPRSLVWKVWTEAEHIVNWWGPEHFTAPKALSDLRPGGRLHYCMRSPDGQDYWSGGEFIEIVPQERIVLHMWFSNEDGERLKPTDYGLPAEVPEIMHDVVTFEALDANRTRLTIERDTPLAVSKALGEDQGWNQSLDKFAAELARVLRS